MVPKEEQTPRKAPVATERVWELSELVLVFQFQTHSRISMIEMKVVFGLEHLLDSGHKQNTV